MKRALFLLPLLTLLPLLGHAATYNACPAIEAETQSINGMTAVSSGGYSNGTAEQMPSSNASSASVAFAFKPTISGNYIFMLGVVATGSNVCRVTAGLNVNDIGSVGAVEWKMSIGAGEQQLYIINSSGSSHPSGGGQGAARIWSLTANSTYTITITGSDPSVIIDYLQPFLDTSFLPAVSGTGLCSYYWNWTSGDPPTVPASGAVWTGMQGPINYTALSGSWPPTGIGQTLFDAEWDGTVMPQGSGTYTFSTITDDGVRLWVNGTAIINDWGDHGPTTDTGTIALTGGTAATIKLQFYQNGGGAEMVLEWWASGPMFPWQNTNSPMPYTQLAAQAIPVANLYPCSGGGGTPTRTFTVSPTFTASPSPTPGGSNPAPTLISLSPTSGATVTFLTGVTLTGTGFLNATTVSFGGTAATGVVWISSTQLYCVAPLLSAGTVTVTVHNSNGTSNGLPFQYLPPVWQGLVPGTRLYGLEYIPFPVQSSGSSHFYDLSMSFTSAAANEVPKNTARWKIVLQNLNGNLNPSVCTDCLQIETRVGPDGLGCTTGYFDQNTINGTNAMSLALPYKPQDLSIDYTWSNSANVPVTQAFDAVGDPRYVPYLDLMGSATGPFANNYNWFFRDLTTDKSGAAYTAFLPDAKFNSYSATGTPLSSNQANVDVPKLFRLVREGVMMTTSVYTAVNGWSNYYFGLGGEIGGDGSNDLPSAVQCDGGPWNASGVQNIDEILGKAEFSSNLTPGASWIRTTNGWYSRPFIGELWPDSLYQSDWSGHASNTSWGNLKNSKNGSGVAYRDSIGNFDQTDPITYTAGGQLDPGGNYPSGGGGNVYTLQPIYHRISGDGAGTMMNGSDVSGDTFDHSSTNYTANLLNDGLIVNNDFNFPMPTTFAVQRPWQLDLNDNNPDEWTMAPYKNRRTTLAIYSASQGQPLSQWGYYDWNNGNADARSSAAVRLTDLNSVVNPISPTAGFYVINGLAPAGTSGINFVARFALLTCIRTFLDAGTPTGYGNTANQPSAGGPVFRTRPIPLVQITSPTNHQDRSHYNPLGISWKERYARWDNLRYTENYPCIDGPQGSPCPGIDGGNGDPSVEWHDSTNLIFNVIYSADDIHWYSAPTNSIAVPGEIVNGTSTGPDVIQYSPSHLYTYSWSISGLPAFIPQTGNKWVRVECFRLDPSGNVMQHYSFHEIQVITAP